MHVCLRLQLRAVDSPEIAMIDRMPLAVAVHVSTKPFAFWSSVRKLQSLVSIVPETILPAHAEHEPARQAYGRSAKSSALSSSST